MKIQMIPYKCIHIFPGELAARVKREYPTALFCIKNEQVMSRSHSVYSHLKGTVE